MRNLFFDIGVLPSKKFDVPVICVGNLETGGSGKSPLVNYIVMLLTSNDQRVAVLSRGYGRSTRGFRSVEGNSTALEVGDEPLQAKKRFPAVTVAVCEDRVKGIEQLLRMEPAPQVIVMDDGFQHRWVKPSFSILVTPSRQPFWKNHLLPVGTLREAKTQRKRADVVVVSNSNGKLDIPHGLTASVFHSRIALGELIQFSGDELSVSEIRDVVLFSGIAHAERFEESVSQEYNVRRHLKFPDHHNYATSDLLSLRKLDSFGPAVNAVITTEKDAVRLSNIIILDELKNVPIFYLPIHHVFGEKASEFNKMILEHGKYA